MRIEMPRDEILSEPAGPRLDAWIANVMGGKPLFLMRNFNGNPFPEGVPAYSTDIAAAFQVVEAMRAGGWHFTVGSVTVGPGACVDFFRLDRNQEFSTTAESSPLAICRAALLAVGVTAKI